MADIIYATDFSDNARHALPYAISLSRAYEATLVLYHCCYVPVYASDVPYEVIPTDKYLIDAADKLEALKNQLKSEYADLNIMSVLEEGVVNEKLVKYAVQHKTGFMVMGIKGTSVIKNIFMGSTAAYVLEHSKCRTLVIPGDTVFKPFSRIIYATDYRETDFSYLNELSQLAAFYQAEIIIVHVSDMERTDSFEQNMFQWFQNEMRQEVTYEKITFQLYYSQNISEALNQVIKTNDADLLTVITRKHNLLTKLFDKSVTREMVHHIHIPMLSFHLG